jgi:hypothetical protein
VLLDVSWLLCDEQWLERCDGSDTALLALSWFIGLSGLNGLIGFSGLDKSSELDSVRRGVLLEVAPDRGAAARPYGAAKALGLELLRAGATRGIGGGAIFVRGRG